MERTGFSYSAQIDSLVKAYNNIEDACEEVYETLSKVWGPQFADTHIAPLYELAGNFGNYIEKYMGTLLYLGLCIEK